MPESVVPTATGFLLESFDQKIQEINGQPISRSEKQNLYLQGVSIAAQQTAAFGGLGAVTAVTASLAAAYAQAQVVNEHLSEQNINPTPEIAKKLLGDEISLISDRIQTVGALANLIPASKPLALSLEELGSAADALGLYIALPGYIKDIASVAGQQLLGNLQSSISTALRYIESASLPGAIKQNLTDITGNISSLLSNSAAGNSTDADLGNLENNARSLGANVISLVNDYISSPQSIDVTQEDSNGSLQLSLSGDSSPALTTGFDFQSGSKNALTSFVYGDNGNLRDISIDRSGIESQSFYSDGVAGFNLTKQLFSYPDGSSASIDYYANGASLTKYYSGDSQSGQLTGTDLERANGTSALTTFDSAGDSVTTYFSGPEGTGDIIGGDGSQSGGSGGASTPGTTTFIYQGNDLQTSSAYSSSVSVIPGPITAQVDVVNYTPDYTGDINFVPTNLAPYINSVYISADGAGGFSVPNDPTSYGETLSLIAGKINGWQIGGNETTSSGDFLVEGTSNTYDGATIYDTSNNKYIAAGSTANVGGWTQKPTS